MLIKERMRESADAIRSQVLPKLQNQFTSHQFIQRYTQLFQADYVDALFERRQRNTEGIFQQVHRDIITLLVTEGSTFGVRRIGVQKGESQNIFGDGGKIQLWEKITVPVSEKPTSPSIDLSKLAEHGAYMPVG
ncbi:hypothetical protein [Acanthopleuribacter pedis]|uniref:Uncharacterized protein n=1 Tax=Acanthopleuribacter pedis TaxID=442870 RepID=A0A8J7U6L3_9BACT|nr:hypothetical protein [Acanthopleuribacter pedis]MBO1322892.1 hypothetical protein [Acanthopleuribacter pedis]